MAVCEAVDKALWLAPDVERLSDALLVLQEERDDWHNTACAEAKATEEVEAEVAALRAALAACRKERDEVYAVNAAANYDRANAAEAALQDIVSLCEPDRVPLPLLNSKVIRRAQETTRKPDPWPIVEWLRENNPRALETCPYKVVGHG